MFEGLFGGPKDISNKEVVKELPDKVDELGAELTKHDKALADEITEDFRSLSGQMQEAGSAHT